MGFLSGLLDRLKSEDAVDYTHLYIGGGASPMHAETDKHYVRVWLRSARIVQVRRWSKKFHATVHGQFSYTDRLAGKQEVMCVVAPDRAFEEMDPSHLERFIVVNQPLLGPIPYRGELGMDVALFSVSATDLAKPYLELLTGLTSTASVAFLGQVKPFVEPLRRGAEALLGDGDQAQLEIGLSRTDTELRIGNILVARAPKGSIDASKLRIDPQDYRLLDQSGQPVTEFPYMILGIEASAERADYAAIPEVRSGWAAVRQAAAEGQTVAQVRERFDALRRAIWFSSDLIQTDKRRIVEIFNRELVEAGYDLAPPVEMAALESVRAPRPLREAADVLSGYGRRRAGPALEAAGALESARSLEAAGGLATGEALEERTTAGRISMAELQALMGDPDTPEAVLRQYFVVDDKLSRPFAPSIMPDPARVEIAAPSDALEGAMAMTFANGLCRFRRQRLFRRRRSDGSRKPVLVSEGDSWFQFPLYLEDVIDQLLPDFDIWSVDAAGDTLQNMVLDNAEYLKALNKYKHEVAGFLFSGGGNDIVGEDSNGDPIISQIVRPFEAGRPAEWYLDNDAFAQRLLFIEDCYREVITQVGEAHNGLPIICHGYDYAVPGGYPGDPRNPSWASQDAWIGRPMREDLGITDPALQRAIVRIMIDRFNVRVRALCGGNNPDGIFRHAWHVDVRGVVSERWADELHPTNDGFRAVGTRFLNVLTQALARESIEAATVPSVGVVSPNSGDDDGVHPDEQAPEWVLPPFEAVRPWRVAGALKALKRQVNARAPARNRASDGSIGDAAHATRKSDHNPWVIDAETGVVTAMDITHDPDGGCDADLLAEAIRASRDPRVKYMIWNRRIVSSEPRDDAAAWEWRAYSGSNPHTKHVHISVRPEKASYDSDAEWRV